MRYYYFYYALIIVSVIVVKNLLLVPVPNDHDNNMSIFDPTIIPNTTSSTARVVNPMFEAEYERIDSESDYARCARYGYEVSSSRRKRRRLFFGAMVADEHWDTFRIHAAEAYNAYAVVALIESNKTFQNTPRELQLTPTRIAAIRQLFGPLTNVVVEYWSPPTSEQNVTGMIRENMQRNAILKLWKDQYMLPTDVGIMADMDEIYMRDFLRAARVCDIPQFNSSEQSCQQPKLLPYTLMLEGSPDCIARDAWYHPDMVIGACIEGIGGKERPIPMREYKQIHGNRVEGWGLKGKDDYSDEMHAGGIYPLLNGVDMRLLDASTSGLVNHVNISSSGILYGIAFHIHNFFTDFETLRHKYKSYGHGDVHAHHKPLSKLDPKSLDLLVRCAHNIRNTRGKRVRRIDTKWAIAKPIFFQNATYCQKQRELMNRLVLQDEARYGSIYNLSS